MENNPRKHFTFYEFDESEVMKIEGGLRTILAEEGLKEDKRRPLTLPVDIDESIERLDERTPDWRPLKVSKLYDPEGLVDAYIRFSEGFTEGSKFYEIDLDLRTRQDNSKYNDLTEKIQNYKEKVSSRGAE